MHDAIIDYQTDLKTQEGVYQVNYGDLPPPANTVTSTATSTSAHSSAPSRPAPSTAPSESPTHREARQDITTLDQFGEIINSGGSLNEKQTRIATNIVSILEGHVASSKETMAFLSKLATVTGTLGDHNQSISAKIVELDQKLDTLRHQLSNHGP